MAPAQCEYCGSDFGSGAGLASHYRARITNGGICGDSRIAKLKQSQGTAATTASITFRTPAPVLNSWSILAENNLASPASLKRKAGTLLVPATPEKDQDEDLARMRSEMPRLAIPRAQRADSAVDECALPRVGLGQGRLPGLRARPDIRDVPPGEEGMWQIDPVTGKRNLSILSGIPMLDRKCRDFLIHEARVYEPWKLGPDRKLL